jgi:hypothetical protein
VSMLAPITRPGGPNIKLTCPAAQTMRDNDAQEATRNNSRGRVRCSDRFAARPGSPSHNARNLVSVLSGVCGVAYRRRVGKMPATHVVL